MKKNSTPKIFFFICFLIPNLFIEHVFAWKIPTHELLSREAVVASNLNNGVLQSLGFENLETEITGNNFNNETVNQNIIEWVESGARFEDAGNLLTGRLYNHFHNPLLEWPFAGLNDDIIGFPLQGESSVLWAQNATILENPDWSWWGIRESFFQGLTSITSSEREAQFARVFAGLGHMIHLVQDVAQPDHVRNDAHAFDFFLVQGMEHWAKVNPDDIEDFVSIPDFPNLSLDSPINNLAPLARFWDTDQYDGTSNTEGLAKGLTVGLAEYTNRNYFSEDTIDSSDSHHQFPFPSVDIQNYHVCADDPPPSSFGSKRWYISRDPCDSTDGIDHFLAQSLLRDVVNQQPVEITSAMQIDNRVRRDYASDLIPRAVGYSAGLINYFFRVQLAVEPVNDTHLRVYNQSSEPLNSGTIELFYDNPQNQRVPITASPFVISAPIAPGQTSDSIPYIPPLDNANPGRYWAVFSGTLGAENNAVIGSFGFLWQEEWDNGITGNHSWWHMATDPIYINSLDPGSVINTETSNGILTMENSRVPQFLYADPDTGIVYYGYPDNQVNESIVGVFDYIGSNDEIYFDGFPIPVTPETEVHVKVNEMTTLGQPPPPQCAYQGQNGAFQHISIDFNQDFFVGPDIELTISGQQFIAGDTFKPVFISIGQETRLNIYQALQDRGVVITPPLEITHIGMTQQLFEVCDPFPTPQSQMMEIEYIRILDVPQTP
jgi:hypothetical protein